MTQHWEHSASGHQKPFPGGWGSPVVTPAENKEDGPLSNLSTLGQSLKNKDRAGSMSSVGTNTSHHSHHTCKSSTPVTAEHGIYQSPVPSYAISFADAIPQGYVAHARDACVNVDYQWDSMREPQNWGNGGEYGEEWSSMHKRFRKGLQQMVSWYQNEDSPGELLQKNPTSPSNSKFPELDEPQDADTDLVLIVVTHGAGCNALIGALTNQPVLLDVGMASLTMAVRNPTPPNSPSAAHGAMSKTIPPTSSEALSISDQYQVKLVANTEHLRNSSTSSTSSLLNSPSIGNASFRERFVSHSGSFESNQARPITNSALGSVRRTASIASSAPRRYKPDISSSVGLWSAAPPAQEEPLEETEDDLIINFGDDASKDYILEEKEPFVNEKEQGASAGDQEEDEVAPLGLWGTPRPPGIAERNRDIAPKRRWTVNERT